MNPPVGVGPMSRSPNGNAGLTTTSGSPSAAKRSASSSLSHFERMYALPSSQSLRRKLVRLVGGRAVCAAPDGGDRAV